VLQARLGLAGMLSTSSLAFERPEPVIKVSTH
jgi:hypothetical protein